MMAATGLNTHIVVYFSSPQYCAMLDRYTLNNLQYLTQASINQPGQYCLLTQVFCPSATVLRWGVPLTRLTA